MPKVSVLVPIYNVEKYLSECLKSIINQTLEDIEVICINDGSTDNSLSIIQEYALADSRIKIINKNNTGYGNSMNIGLSEATGEYIGIVESDDFASLDMFEKLYNNAEKNSAEVVMSNFIEFRSNSKINERVVENFKLCKYNLIFSAIDETNVFFTTPSIWSGIYKKKFLLDNDIVFNETPGASYQDLSFSFKVWASAKRVFLLKDAFLHYRKDNMSSSVNTANKVFCVYDEYKEIENFLEKYHSMNVKLHTLAFSMKVRSYKWNYNHIISPFQYAFLLKMAKEFKKGIKKGYLKQEYLTLLEINEINNIITNTYEYFKDTAKEYRDERLKLTPTLNQQFYVQGFFDIINKYDNVIIYGAGVIGKKLAEELLRKEINIWGFAVSNSVNNPKKLLDIDVYCINDLTQYIENGVILIAVKEKDQYDIIDLLTGLKFKNIIYIDSLILNALSAEK